MYNEVLVCLDKIELSYHSNGIAEILKVPTLTAWSANVIYVI